MEGLRNADSNKFRRLATELTTIETTPAFGIGQRAILARTPAGNVLWDCIATAEGPGQRHGNRDLPPPLLHHNGGVQPRPRGSADPPARG